MTSGDANGTDGEAPPRAPSRGARLLARLGPMAVIIPIALTISFVNSTSELMEARRDGHTLDVWEPFVWEYTSVVFVLALAPLIAWAVGRWQFTRETLVSSLAIHAGLTLVFSLVHVVGMAVLRKAIYAAAGDSYDFTHGQPLMTFLYEWRKDAVTYTLLAVVFSLVRFRAEAVAERAPASPERIEVRDGGSVLFLDPREILRVEAAGNYVEFHTAARAHLVRGTLAAWEAKLAPLGFVRVHRSRVVNRARIREVKPTPSGDVELTLDDGQVIAGSRRYREGLG